MSLSKDHKRKIANGVREAAKRRKEQATNLSLTSIPTKKELEENSKDLVSQAISRDVFKNSYLGLNADIVRGVLNSVENGILLDWAEFAESMVEGDPKLKGLIKQRKSAISARNLKIKPKNSDDKSVFVARFVEKAIAEIKDFQTGIRALQNGIFVGVGCTEILWKVDSIDGINVYLPKSLIPIPAKRLRISEIENSWQYVLSDYSRFPETIENPFFKHPYKFMIHSPDDNDLPHFRGLLRSLAFIFLFKKLGINYWIGGAEKHAFPPIFALVPPNTKPASISNLVSNLYNLSNDGVGVIENTVKIEALNTKSSDGNSIYKDQLAYYDTVMTQLILGGTLIVEAASGPGGNRALGEVHERSKDEIISADAQELAETIKFGLVKYILELNKHLFGGTVPELPEVVFEIQNTTPKINQIHLQAGAVTKNELRKDIGLPIVPWGDEIATFGGVVEQPTEQKENLEVEEDI